MVNPALIPDIMQRIKALGFDAISSYFFWGLVNPAAGDIDMSGWKSLEPFLQAANDAGLWVIARPGPWVVSQFVLPFPCTILQSTHFISLCSSTPINLFHLAVCTHARTHAPLSTG